MSEAVAQPKRTGLLIWLISSQIVALVTLIMWLVGAGISLMAVQVGSPPAWLIAFYFYPIYPLSLSIGAWVAYSRQKNRLAAILSLLLIPPLILFCLAIAFNL